MSETRVDSAATHLLAGTLAGTSQLLVGHPFDTVKVKLQSAHGSESALAVARQTLSKEGLRGIYRGMGPPLATVPAFNAVLFSTRGAVNDWLAHPDGSPLTVAEHMLSSVGAGIVASFLASPTELFKCRLQHQGTLGTARERHAAWVRGGCVGLEPTVFRGPWDVMRAAYAQEGGVRGWTTGLGATLLREIPGNALMFGAYESVKAAMASARGLPSTQQLDSASLMLAGGIGGTAFWIFTYPTDVIKSRLQTQRFEAPMYGGIIDCAQKLYRAEGLAGLYRGIGPCLARAFPANAAAFVTYEAVMTAFRE